MKLVTNIGVRSGNGTAIECMWDDLPMVSQEAIIRYGFQRYVNDRVGGSDTTAEQKVLEAHKIVDRLVSGDVERVSRTVDPLLAETRRQIGVWLKANKPDLAKKARALDPKERFEFFDALAEKSDAFEKMAAAELERRAAERERLGEIDLGDIAI